MVQILITGASGFIGRKLAGKALNLGYTVIGIDIVNNHIEHENYSHTLIDPKKKFSEQMELVHHLQNKNIHTIFHLAAISSSSKASQSVTDTIYANYVLTLDLFELVLAYSVHSNFVFSSSTEIYDLTLAKDLVLKPTNSIYAFSKFISERSLQDMSSHLKGNLTIFRFCNTYGREKGNFIVEYLIFANIKGDKPTINTPNEVKSFLFVDDHIDVYLKYLSNPKQGIFNVVGKNRVDINSLAKLIESIVNNHKMDSNISIDQDGIAPIEDTIRAFGWEPKVNLKDGLKSTYELMLNNFRSSDI